MIKVVWSVLVVGNASVLELAVVPTDALVQTDSQYQRRHPSTADINKKAELSQRQQRDAPFIWCPEKEYMPTATFPENFNGLLKFVALPFLEIIGGYLKILAVPGYASVPFCPKF